MHLGVVDLVQSELVSGACEIEKISLLVKNSMCELNNGSEVIMDASNLVQREAAMFDGEATDAIANHTYVAMIKNMIDDISLPMIAITTNVVDLSWRGNYWRDRPTNMNSYLSVEREFWREMGIPCVSLDMSRVCETTMDNIHPSKLGFRKLEQLVRKEIAKLH